MQPLAHSYTNHTTGDGSVVRKVYQGPDAVDRCRREATALTALAGRLPVAPVVARDELGLTMGFLPGVPGQNLIKAGLAGPVLAACGRMLRQVHAADPGLIEPGPQPGQVLVHGDYGPNNTLFSPDGQAVTGVVDWEWAHAGAAVEDLAWCEWIVRMHHPDAVAALDGFFASYGDQPAWTDRQHVMTSRCRDMLELCQRWEPGGVAGARWRDRLRITQSWTE
jgi:tRNA A-37 threonylcarbamoyl transferase component Bud32